MSKLKSEHLPKILSFGLIINAISIIFSVDYLFNSHKYVELAVTAGLFAVICLLIRRLNNEHRI